MLNGAGNLSSVPQMQPLWQPATVTCYVKQACKASVSVALPTHIVRRIHVMLFSLLTGSLTLLLRYHSCIHSWDICNEPRNRTETRPPRSVAPNNGDIASWVHEAAGHVKSLDNKHPVTVGSEGFFGPSNAPTGEGHHTLQMFSHV